MFIKFFNSQKYRKFEIKIWQIEDKEYEKMIEAYSRRSKKNVSVKIKTPNHTSTLSPAGSFFKRRFSIKGFSLDDDVKKYQSDKNVISQNENFNAIKESNNGNKDTNVI